MAEASAVTMGFRATNRAVRPAGMRDKAARKHRLYRKMPVKPSAAVVASCLRSRRGKPPSSFHASTTSSSTATPKRPLAAVIGGICCASTRPAIKVPPQNRATKISFR